MTGVARYDPAAFPEAPAARALVGRRLSGRLRLLLLAVATASAALLAVAGRLEPAADGFGTHRQLGLGACRLVATLGVRCPTCGMTTAWAHAVRGEWAAAASTNAGGALLAIVAMAAAPWAAASGLTGRWRLFALTEARLYALVGGVFAVTLFDYVCRCWAPRWIALLGG